MWITYLKISRDWYFNREPFVSFLIIPYVGIRKKENELNFLHFLFSYFLIVLRKKIFTPYILSLPDKEETKVEKKVEKYFWRIKVRVDRPILRVEEFSWKTSEEEREIGGPSKFRFFVHRCSLVSSLRHESPEKPRESKEESRST